jgi:hypothetical protein
MRLALRRNIANSVHRSCDSQQFTEKRFCL